MPDAEPVTTVVRVTTGIMSGARSSGPMGARYDAIGIGYAAHRRPDPRWMVVIHGALDGMDSVVDVGAGAGSYEPRDRRVVAVDPSRTMLAQREAAMPPAVQGVAEALPFADATFDAALAVLTTHHWTDAAAGLAELRRVARRQVVVTWDPELLARSCWLVAEYVPEVAAAEAALATLDAVVDALEVVAVLPLPVPADCTDGVFAAYWRRPEAYLDAGVRAAISGLALLDDSVLAPAMARLAADLESGAWQERHADLLARDELDVGYRVVVAGPATSVS
jgi:SAM-dependent methyltransferase